MIGRVLNLILCCFFIGKVAESEKVFIPIEIGIRPHVYQYIIERCRQNECQQDMTIWVGKRHRTKLNLVVYIDGYTELRIVMIGKDGTYIDYCTITLDKRGVITNGCVPQYFS